MPLYKAFEDIVSALSLLKTNHKFDNVLLCFDNKSHPMKADMQTSRQNDGKYHEDELTRIYQRDDIDDADVEAVV